MYLVTACLPARLPELGCQPPRNRAWLPSCPVCSVLSPWAQNSACHVVATQETFVGCISKLPFRTDVVLGPPRQRQGKQPWWGWGRGTHTDRETQPGNPWTCRGSRWNTAEHSGSEVRPGLGRNAFPDTCQAEFKMWSWTPSEMSRAWRIRLGLHPPLL